MQQPDHTLAFVDHRLATAMAVKHVGTIAKDASTKGVGLAFNWIVQTTSRLDETQEVQTDIRDLLPEDLMHALYRALPNHLRFKSIRTTIDKLSDMSQSRLYPGNPITFTGQLRFNDVPLNFDPFNPPDIKVKVFQFHGERCFVGEMCDGDGFRLPIYFSADSQAQILYCNNQPVEVTGIVRWCPPYSPGGAKSLSLAVRAAAIWLQ